MSSIDIKNLTKRFGALTAVDDVSMHIPEGEVLCLLGPSGCGKTTTLRMIAGLEQETTGGIFLNNRQVNHLSTRQRDISMVFQFYALYPTLTVEENVAFPLRSEVITNNDLQTRVSRVLSALQLLDVAGRTPGQLGEGEKQRVAVARAVVRTPNCFLFDEPLSRLDVSLRHQMRGEIKEILGGLSKATVIVTHDQLEALTMADRIAVMRCGIIEQIATPHEIFTEPQNLFVAGFVGTPAMNLLPATLKHIHDTNATFQICGQTVVFAVDPAVRHVAIGTKVTIGIRPRAFTLHDEAMPYALSGQIDLVEPMGAETLIHAMAEDTEVRVVVDRSVRPEVGANLHIQPKHGQVLVFDDDGRLLKS